MKRNIILSADSTCDLGSELRQKYDVRYFNYHIQLGNKSYIDMVEIMPEDIYEAWLKNGQLPKTAAINPMEYHVFFKEWVEAGYDVVHLNLGSGISSAYQNCRLVTEELGNIYAIDSASLSSGIGLLVVKAGDMIKAGLSAEEIQKRLLDMRGKVDASFILDTLEFMKAGGRCNALLAFGANLLSLKPCIEVDNNRGGSMGVGKKYRGSMEKVLVKYVNDRLGEREDLDLEHIFITHSGSPQSDIELVKDEIKKIADFREIHVTRANGTISSHCGPRTLGILFMTK